MDKPTVNKSDAERYWMGEGFTFAPDALPDEVWMAILMDAASIYGRRTTPTDHCLCCDDGCQDHEYCEVFGHHTNHAHCEQSYKRAMNERSHFMAEGMAYAGHKSYGTANEYGDHYVVAYQYDDRGHGAIVGVNGDTLKVSCYVN